MSDIKNTLILGLSLILPFQMNWSIGFFSVIGIIIAVICFWEFLKKHKIYYAVIIAFGTIVSIINYGQLSIFPELIAISVPTLALMIARWRPLRHEKLLH